MMTQKILHIDSDPASRQSVRQILENADYAVINADDGLSGVQTAQTERPDLILISPNLPGLDGYETATRLKGLPGLSNVPIVALMPQPEAGDRERALTAGCDGCLILPTEPDVLLARVTKHLEGWRETLSVEEENAYLHQFNQHLAGRLEQQIQEFTKANESLAHTDMMKSRFINLAAHELRTPLAALRGYLGVLTSPDSTVMAHADANTLEIIEGVNGCVDRLQGIVQDMLDMTRIETGTLQLRHSPVSLTLLFNKIRKEFQEVASQRQQTLTISKTDHIPMIWGDGERITQILRNLVSNAIKYTPDGGKIGLQAKIISNRDLAAPISSNQEQLVKITVSDSGIGVSPNHQEHIFKSFYEVRDIELHSSSKTDFMGGGAGLGLPIARGVAKAHGGSLHVESDGYDPERCPGSRFHLVLPLGEPSKE
jgi:signal transduction histidine kinase